MAKLLEEVREETTTLLSELIKIDTTNPPGNETAAAKFLAKYLENEGLKCEIIESAPGRGNMITRIKGEGKSPSLLLLSHLDVVPANPKEWSVPPFSGLVKDGFVWGRGSVDCKSLVAIEAVVMKLLKREGFIPKGDVIFAATADEEIGEKDGIGYGVGWLVKNYPEKIKTDYVINEGGGFSIPVDGKHVFTVQTAEKGVIWLKIKAKGRPGHGSIPSAADNAVLRMAKVAETLGTYRSNVRVVPTVKQMIEGLARERGLMWQAASKLLTNPESADSILDRLAKDEPTTAEFLRSMLRNTIAPTIIRGGVKENIIPSECEAVFDCRVLPGETVDSFLEEIKSVLSNAGVELEKLEFEFIQAGEASESPIETPLYEILREVVRSIEPNADVVPYMTTGGTDSSFLRELGCVCYGFAPMKTDMSLSEFLKLAHGIDERISIDNLVFGVSVLYEVVKRFMQ